jgi:hypothetical protein
MIEKRVSISAPFWSVLPPIPLLGVGTPLVESVEHYVTRLAWITGTSVKRILELGLPYKEPGRHRSAMTAAFCGPSISYKLRIANLEALTGIDTIRCGSFYLLDNLLAQGAIGRNSTYHRWCPQCLEEWDEETSWEPLQWSIGLRATCPIHDCDLEDRCRHCNATQKLSVTYLSRRICNACRRSVGGEGKITPKSQYVRWADSQISKLVELCATPGREPISGDTFELFAKEVLRSAPSKSFLTNAGMSALARLVRVDRKLCNRVKNVRVNLRTLINACALQGISIDEMLLNPMQAASLPLVKRWGDYKLLELSSVMSVDNSAALAHCLKDLLSHPRLTYLPSPNYTLKEMNVKESSFSLECREIFNHYTQRYRAQGTSGLLHKNDMIFIASLECLETIRANPFATPDFRRARRLISASMSIAGEEALRMAKCANHWRRTVELCKARALQLTGHELKAYKKLGGIVERGP